MRRFQATTSLNYASVICGTASMTRTNLASASRAATASGRIRDRTTTSEEHDRIARGHQAAVQGLIDFAWKEASVQLSPTELAKIRALVGQDAERCKVRPLLGRTKSRRGQKSRKGRVHLTGPVKGLIRDWALLI